MMDERTGQPGDPEMEGAEPTPDGGANQPADDAEPSGLLRNITLDDVSAPPAREAAHPAEYRLPEGVRSTRPRGASAAARPPHRAAHVQEPRAVASAVAQARRAPVGYSERRMRWFDFAGALALAVLAFLSVLFTYRGYGHSWDEALYLKGAEQAADWTTRVATGDAGLLSADEIGRYWGKRADGEDPLHPEVGPVPKLATGMGLRKLAARGFDPMVATRLPVAVAFALTVALLYWVGVRAYGRVGGTAAALMYALMPRVFGHAHIAASETLLAFFTVCTAAAFLAALKRPWFALLTGVAFGLAVATKVTALILPFPLILWGQLYHRRDYGSNVFAMAFLAPAVAVAVWPWMWTDTAVRLLEYLAYYLTHQSTAVFFMGASHGYMRPPAPWHYPLTITALSLPEWALVFGAAGVLAAVGRAARRPAPVLFLLLAAAPLAVSSLPGAPKYDGERLFFPAFAFIALLAGGGFAAVVGRLTRGLEPQARQGIATLALMAILVWGIVDIMVAHPNHLNFFNRLVGGPSGAQNRYETSYWGEGVNEEVTAWLRDNAKPGMKVKPLALNELAFRNLQDWGKLPKQVDFAPAAPPFDLIVLQNRMGFFGNAERALFTAHKPLASFDAQGVPRILVYAGDTLETTGTVAPAASPPVASADKAPLATPAPVTMPPPGARDAEAQTTVPAAAPTQPTPPPSPSPSTEPALPEVPPERITTIPGQRPAP
jgi:hypothetical protein